jgi:hypothetical protein
MQIAELTDIERRLLNDWQQHFPLSSTPYADIARELGVNEEEVLQTLTRLLAHAASAGLVPCCVPTPLEWQRGRHGRSERRAGDGGGVG